MDKQKWRTFGYLALLALCWHVFIVGALGAAVAVLYLTQ